MWQYNYSSELYHHGIVGMKWHNHMIKKAEKTLGRKVAFDDFLGDTPTNKGIKNVKKVDELKGRYKKVKKKGDLNFDYMRGYSLKYNTALSNHEVEKLIKKMENNHEASSSALYEKSMQVKSGKKVVYRYLQGTLGTLGIATLSALYATSHNR